MLSLKCRSSSGGVLWLLNITDHEPEGPVVLKGDNFENFVFVEDADSAGVEPGTGETAELEDGPDTHDD